MNANRYAGVDEAARDDIDPKPLALSAQHSRGGFERGNWSVGGGIYGRVRKALAALERERERSARANKT